jgi:hypothetical protein
LPPFGNTNYESMHALALLRIKSYYMLN